MSTSHSLPRAVISMAAMQASAAAAVRAGGTVADLRGDAFGHGAVETARVAAAAGAAAMLVDDHATVTRLKNHGIGASVVGESDMDTTLLYGLGSSAASPMRLIGRILSTKPAIPGDAVSYGYTHRVKALTTLALVTGGYAQGIVRSLGNHAEVEIGGALHPIVGRVAMDVCVVDLQTADTTAAARLEGAEAVYFGGDGPARSNLKRWMAITGMTAAELVTVAGAKAVREWTT